MRLSLGGGYEYDELKHFSKWVASIGDEIFDLMGRLLKIQIIRKRRTKCVAIGGGHSPRPLERVTVRILPGKRHSVADSRDVGSVGVPKQADKIWESSTIKGKEKLT
ncbi:cytochrome P450 [Striga asiatica]|uniref:Cytochrome P450 n=1 Tax=Striga asiatica TaxID=4170 RepID=A0A5A7PP69_STRAF|nr:cytochrome P450 [Striga asiatica]